MSGIGRWSTMIGWHNLTTVVLALACIFAFGAASTTLESTVSTKPAEVLDPNWDQLQIENEEAGEMKEQIEANKNQGSGNENQQVSKRQDDGNQPSGGEQRRGDQSGDGSGDGSGAPGDRTQSWLDKLLAFLAKLLILLPIALVALALAAAYVYRERLLEALASAERPGGIGSQSRESWADLDPSDQVERAWYEMVSRMDVARPRTKTPAELQRAAADAGLDPDAAETVTRAFRATTYGARDLSTGERDAVRDALTDLSNARGGRPR